MFGDIKQKLNKLKGKKIKNSELRYSQWILCVGQKRYVGKIDP